MSEANAQFFETEEWVGDPDEVDPDRALDKSGPGANTPFMAFIAVLMLIAAAMVGLFELCRSTVAAEVERKQLAPVSSLLRAAWVEEQGKLSRYQWINQKAGILRIPLERAKDLVLFAPEAAAGAQKKTGRAGERSSEPVPEAAAAAAKEVYNTRCASCHGAEGKGDGLAAYAVSPKPRNYADAEWQDSVTDDELSHAITHGGLGVGKSYMMPASPDLRSRPDVVAGLVAMVRAFVKP